jgi:PAS domain S-box-containing protein
MADLPSIDILVIEDDADTRANLCDILELDGHRVETAASAAQALARTDWTKYSAILLDRRLPDGSAEDLLPRLKGLAPEAAVMVVTGYADLGGAIAALRQGAADYILKPVNMEALRASLARIAERRHLAHAKEQSEAAFRTLVEAAPCLIVILRPDTAGAGKHPHAYPPPSQGEGERQVAVHGKIIYFSPFGEKLTGYRAADVLGRECCTVFIRDNGVRDVLQQAVRRVLAGEPAREFETAIYTRDGSRRAVLWNLAGLRDYDGGPAVLMVGQDITKLKEVQEQALKSERLATLGQMVAGIAHESRNALQLIQASVEMLALEVEDRPEALELVASIQGAEDRLHRLFEDIRGYAAPITLERSIYNVAKVWRTAWDQLGNLRGRRQAELHEEISGVDLDCAVDLFSLERVFRNMLENSLAACADPVHITVECAEVTHDGKPSLRISVRDNGPGLNAEQRQRIFQPFYTTKRQGTGLGMPIAKRIVEAHGGQMAVGDLLAQTPEVAQTSGVSARGPGAEIVITLPRGSE